MPKNTLNFVLLGLLLFTLAGLMGCFKKFNQPDIKIGDFIKLKGGSACSRVVGLKGDGKVVIEGYYGESIVDATGSSACTQKKTSNPENPTIGGQGEVVQKGL